ncbi:MAG: phosphoglycerate kinase [Bacilli bacterium]|nr:phosphoglycerate kinase [Bacilli bacterium]
MSMKTVKDMDIENKKVIIRCDLNVPIIDGKIIDNNRIKESLQTINYLLDNNCKIIIFAHLGRIKEEKDLKKNTLKPVSKELSKLLNKEVLFIDETRGEKLEKAISNMESKDIILVENTRYEDLDGKKESSNDKELGKYWASLGEVFVNDAFGTLHRAHASNVGIASNLPSCIGFLIEKELNVLKELDKPEKPFVVMLGGAKVKDKIGVIKKLVTKADYILIGGGMSYTFLKAEGYNIGTSLLDKDSIDFCTEVLKKYEDKIVLPVDIAVTNEFTNDEKYRTVDITDIKDNEMGMDLGPKSEKLFEKYLSKAKTVIWNGPVGVYEFSKYKKSTDLLLKYLTDNNIKTILGGGDIVAAYNNANLKNKVYHASTGGGATLEYLEGKKLPGLEAIK